MKVELEQGFAVAWKSSEDLKEVVMRYDENKLPYPGGWKDWKNDNLQKQSLLIRMICQQEAGNGEVLYEQSGKPFLSNGRLSISHSQNYVAVAYHPYREIGVDVEEPHTRIKKIAHRFLHPQEKKWVDLESVETLTVIWSVKEAVFKTFGGMTTFFSEKIEVQPFQCVKGSFHVMVNICTETGMRQERVDIQVHDSFVFSYLECT